MLSDNIKKARESLKISQRELGRRINKTGQFISLIEQGKNKPSLDVLEKIAEALEVTPNDLISYEFEEKMNAEVSKDVDNIIKKYPKQKEKILDIRRYIDNIIIDEFYKAVTFKDTKTTSKTLSNNLGLYRELIWTIYELSNGGFAGNSKLIENKDFYKLYNKKDEEIKKINDILDKIFKNYLIRYGLVEDEPKESDLKFNRDPNLP